MSITELVTAYNDKYTERLAADKVAEALKVEETTLKQQLITALRDADLYIAGNDKVSFTRRTKTRFQAIDWGQIHEFIISHDAWDLVQRRLSDTAVIERGGQIPGVESYEYDDLSRPTKVK